MVEFASNMYTVVVERPDGSTFSQEYQEFEDLITFFKSLGEDYWIVDIY